MRPQALLSFLCCLCSLCSYVVTTGELSPTEIPVSLGEVADQKMILKEAFYSLIYGEKHLSRDKKSKALPIHPSSFLSGKSCDETFELDPQQAGRTMEGEIPLEKLLSAQVISTVTVSKSSMCVQLQPLLM